MVTVYIIWNSARGKHYVGMTNDFNRRLVEHNAGKVPSTKANIPWERLFTEEARDHTEVLKSPISPPS